MVDEIAAAQSVAGVKRLREARAPVVGHPLLPDLERAAGAKRLLIQREAGPRYAGRWADITLHNKTAQPFEWIYDHYEGVRLLSVVSDRTLYESGSSPYVQFGGPGNSPATSPSSRALARSTLAGHPPVMANPERPGSRAHPVAGSHLCRRHSTDA